MGVDCVKASNEKIAREALESEPKYPDSYKRGRDAHDGNL